MSNSPGETAKRLVSKKARQHFEELQHKVNHYRENLKEKGYKVPDDLNKRQREIKELEKEVVPTIEKQIKSKEQAQQRHQLRRVRSSFTNKDKNQGYDFSR
ncbi:hypothetical protein ShirakiTB12_54110 [Priestia megaterium]|uniref:Mobilization protein n=1 Tax=Priestia megaterium TaxID=1404 RepID=A0AAX6BT49_PRIMG|nr:hypothetical protein [Priestia megaterium]GMG76942.1 hypothetical protein ShirakiTB12_54110 [Priestia megaterium]